MFKESFKKYKSRCPPPDFSDVLDFNSYQAQTFHVKKRDIVNDVHLCGLHPASKWKISEVEGQPGLIHIANPFTPIGQRYWICRSLSSYTQEPQSKLNLDAFGVLQQEEDWWEVCTRDPNRAKQLQPALRWATLGYHHNWDTKVYSEEARGPFPEDLAAVSRCVSEVLGYPDFIAQAAIVNFYHQNSTLAGHTDHSERNSEAPLFSFSFGCSAVFLLGGRTLNTKPTAMFLHSGDIIVMSGESRLSFHGVPKILSKTETCSNVNSDSSPCKVCCEILDVKLYEKCFDNSFWESYRKYIETSRINLNVRQVLYPNETTLCSGT